MRTLIKTLVVERATLFITTNGKRHSLKNCHLQIELNHHRLKAVGWWAAEAA